MELVYLWVQRIQTIKTFIWILLIAVIIFLVNLFWTILSIETSLFYYFSTDNYPFFELSSQEIDTWAVRGQIGDILAGHFSALAFVGIAYSIYLQNESNKQAQEEFLISNMNIKLDRYYKILNENLEIVTEQYLYDYLGMIATISKFSKLSPNQYNQKNKDRIDKFEKITKNQATKIINIEKTSPSAYKTYIDELRLRLYSNEVFRTIHTSIKEYNQTPVFDLYKKETP